MKVRDLILTILAAGVALACAACVSQQTADPDYSKANFDRADAGVHLIRGAFEQGRGPDGNTVVLDAKGGLIVFDTGRHAAHTQKILDYAKQRGLPIVAIFNSHWHLDHISGNPALLDAFPKAVVYSSDAALTEALGGFLARGAENNRKRIAEGKLDPGQLEDARSDLAAVEAGARLHPTVPLEKTQTLAIAGRRIDAHFAKGASAGDIWLYDPKAKLVLAGDLITLPAPFLDTACPIAWRQGLDEILARPFASVVPGHGRVMTRADVTLYRDAFSALIACARGTAEVATCADTWATSVASLQDGAETDSRAARGYARYYVESVLRPGARRADCPE
jgi:glyoxylase-like metal-dependent hydrolase (beta-lactamase superfamily II)